jgi:hypothetical protein
MRWKPFISPNAGTPAVADSRLVSVSFAVGGAERRDRGIEAVA